MSAPSYADLTARVSVADGSFYPAFLEPFSEDDSEDEVRDCARRLGIDLHYSRHTAEELTVEGVHPDYPGALVAYEFVDIGPAGNEWSLTGLWYDSNDEYVYLHTRPLLPHEMLPEWAIPTEAELIAAENIRLSRTGHALKGLSMDLESATAVIAAVLARMPKPEGPDLAAYRAATRIIFEPECFYPEFQKDAPEDDTAEAILARAAAIGVKAHLFACQPPEGATVLQAARQGKATCSAAPHADLVGCWPLETGDYVLLFTEPLTPAGAA